MAPGTVNNKSTCFTNLKMGVVNDNDDKSVFFLNNDFVKYFNLIIILNICKTATISC